eukprot:COSAG05_NODE_18964_length_300_cov_0.701493_1_plen_48_part_00
MCGRGTTVWTLPGRGQYGDAVEGFDYAVSVLSVHAADFVLAKEGSQA